MALDTPTTKEVNDTIIAQLEASLAQTIPLLPKAFLRVLAKTLAAVFIILYKYAGFIFLQMFVKTASFQETTINGRTVIPLVEWGRLIGVGDPASAASAQLTIDITVTDQVGSLPSGTQLVNAGNGVTYITIGQVLLNAATVQAQVAAAADQSGGNGSGVIGNLDPGAILSFANPLANVARDTVVASQDVTGANGESEEAYRQRVVDRFQKRPQGGALADYEIWGEEPAGILNIYPYTGNPGEVNVYAEATPESSGSPDGIPTAAQLVEVDNSIQFDQAGLASRRPANAFVNVRPITRVAFDVTIVGLLADDIDQVEADITTAVTEYLFNRDQFIVGLSVLPRKDQITRSALGGVVTDIVEAAGGVFGSVLLSLDGTSIEIYLLQEGEKAKAKSVSFA